MSKRISDRDLAAMTPYEAASYWFVRQDAGRMAEEDQQELQAWLAASEIHRRVYEQTSSMWQGFEESADEGELRALRVTALTTAPAPKIWPRATAMAAGFVATVACGALIWQAWIHRPADSVVAQPSATEYVTAHNQRSSVTLPDGTLVSMNLDTTLTADLSAGKRVIHLRRGQAFFEVAKDPHRPFIVAAGDRQIQALGTQFDVRLEADRVEVVLVEGRVSVDRSKPSLLDTIARRNTHVELKPGQRLVAAMGKSPSVTATNAAQATSWREGWIVFEDQTVEQAIAELNRYADKPIVASDEAVKRMRLSGVFRIGQPDRFGAVIQELLPISAERGVDGETVLVPRMEAEAR